MTPRAPLCRSAGRLMDILRCRGKRGYEAFLEALEFYYPEHFTLLTGREPAQRCSMILGECDHRACPRLGRHCRASLPGPIMGALPSSLLNRWGH